MPDGSVADAVTDRVPATIAPPAGDVTDTVGPVVSVFATVTLTAAATVVLPAASRARADTV